MRSRRRSSNLLVFILFAMAAYILLGHRHHRKHIPSVDQKVVEIKE